MRLAVIMLFLITLLFFSCKKDLGVIRLTTNAADTLGWVRKKSIKGQALGTTITKTKTLVNRAENHLRNQAQKINCHLVFITRYDIIPSESLVLMGKVRVYGIAFSEK